MLYALRAFNSRRGGSSTPEIFGLPSERSVCDLRLGLACNLAPIFTACFLRGYYVWLRAPASWRTRRSLLYACNVATMRTAQIRGEP